MASLVLLAACGGEPQDGQYAELAQCLTDKGVKMYGAFWCPHCAEQKKSFGDDFRYITYVECDPRGENADRDACLKAGVERYPTWVFPGQEPVIGEQTPEDLARKANCEVPGETATTTPTETATTAATETTEEPAATPSDENSEE